MAWMQTRSGKAFDLTHPDPLKVDFENDVAPQLARLARFVGATVGDLPYTVAQHCTLGAEAMLTKTGSHRLAALFLLHDAHEAYIGDLPTPLTQVIDEFCQGAFSRILHQHKACLDWAIHRAAGLNLPDDVEAAAVRVHDIAVMNAERRALMAPAPNSWGAAIEAVPAASLTTHDLLPWDALTAQEEWLWAFSHYVVHPAKNGKKLYNDCKL